MDGEDSESSYQNETQGSKVEHSLQNWQRYNVLVLGLEDVHTTSVSETQAGFTDSGPWITWYGE